MKRPRAWHIRGKTRPAVTPTRPVTAVALAPLRTPRLLLRDLRPEDRAAFKLVFERSRDALQRWFPLAQPGESPDELFDRLASDCRSEANPPRNTWRRGVFIDASRFAGLISLTHITRGLEWEANINWWISSEYGRRGYATEAVQAVVDYATAELPRGLGLTRLTAMILPENLASRRLAMRTGFIDYGATRHPVAFASRWLRPLQFEFRVRLAPFAAVA